MSNSTIVLSKVNEPNFTCGELNLKGGTFCALDIFCKQSTAETALVYLESKGCFYLTSSAFLQACGGLP